MVEAAKLLGRYAMKERLASGGMGAVWRALDEKLGRDVAVKVLNENLAHDERFVEWFRREARSVAGMTHPNIATVFDFGEDQSRYFIVMELVEGKDLARILREGGPLSPERTVRIGTQICAALAQAHGAGVVHRDIKPGNVIIARDDTAKVTDFGIARATGDSTLTGTGSVLGTAQYISPEQASGAVVGPTSDIYSLGIVVYEMLTGTVPFTGDSAIAVAMRHMNEEVPAPSALSDRVPRALDEVVARATARSPEERWPDAGSMQAALLTAADEASTAPVDGAAAGWGAGKATTATEPTSVMTSPALSPVRAVAPLRAPNILRIGIVALGVLAAIALVLLLVRAIDTDKSRARDSGAGTRGGAEPTSTAPSGYELLDFQGEPLSEVKPVLVEKGIEVEEQLQASDGKEGIILSMDRPVGSVLYEGDRITLTVSTAEHDEDRGKGKGKGKGQNKHDEDGKED